MYKDKYSVTNIIKRDNGLDNLSISIDPAQPEFNKPEEVIFLYTPDMKQFEHFHIITENDELKILYEWLDLYFKDRQ